MGALRSKEFMITVFLKITKTIKTADPRTLLRAQHKLLLKLANKYPKDATIQKLVADANLLGLSAVDLFDEGCKDV